jgi:trimeric autotransporter adhesin
LLCFHFFSTGCNRAISEGDRVLFGLSEIFGSGGGERAENTTNENQESVTRSCTSDVTITTRNISLSEDGDVNAVFSLTSDNGLTETDVDGGTSWGYRSFETCIYPSTAFTGTLELPFATNSNYSGRFTSQFVFPTSMNGDALGSKLEFNGEGTANRQCIRFTRVNDAIRNPVEEPYQITFNDIIQKNGSGETVTNGFYANKFPCPIQVTVDDDEGPGIRVSNISNIMEEPGVATPNSGTFRVRLRIAPTADVTIGINDTWDPINANNREGIATPTSLTFTTINWNVEQIVTVNSVDDLEVDGLKIYTIRTNPAVSSDTDYNGIKPRDVVIYNKDQSVPGYSWERFNGTTGVTATAGGTITGFATDEANQMGSTYANYKLRLRSKPTANVTLNISTNCGGRCQLQTPTLTFTPSNWNTFQNIQLEGRSDGGNSGNQDYNVSFTVTSTDTTYSTTVSKPIFSIRSCDNDNSNLIHPCNFSGSPLGTTGNRFSGAEPSATSFTWLISQTTPPSDTIVPLSSSDTTEGTVPANVVINSSNFNRLETAGENRVVMTHVDDTIVDGNQDWTVITGTSTGGIIFNPIDIFARTTDNEQYFYVNRIGNTSEASVAITATIDVCLGANNPDQTITISAACGTNTGAAAGECGTITPSSVTFSTNSQVDLINASNAGCSNDGKKRTFTVSGLDDTFSDGNVDFVVTLTKEAAPLDPSYTAAPNPGNVTISNHDNDIPGRRIFITTGSFAGEMTAAGVVGADNNCNNAGNRPSGVPSATYRALIVSNSSSEVNNDRLLGTNWPLAANTRYHLCTGSAYTNCSDEHTRIFTTDGAGSFTPTAMDRAFTAIPTDEFWTGMNTDLTPATQTSTPGAGTCNDPATVYRHNCHGFTFNNCPTNAGTFFYGQVWQNNGANSITSFESICTATKRLICVQQ